MRFNCGIALCKIAACFGVVLLHFGADCRFAVVSVPLFMILSVCLSARKLADRGGLIKRLARLYLPFAAWGIIYSALVTILERRVDLGDLIMQLTIGVPACPPLYFIFVLIASTLILQGVELVRGGGVILMVLFVLCFILQYTGVNYAMCSRLPFHPSMAVGRFAELFPMAVMGCLMWKLREHKRLMSITLGVAAFLLAAIQLSRLNLSAPGFGYSGLSLFLETLLISGLAILAEGVSMPNACEGSLKIFSGFTAGVYYIHLLVGKALELVIGRNRGWCEAIAVFCISVVIVWWMKKKRGLAWIVA